MGMVFCRGCGKEIHESAPMCPHCGAPQAAVSNTTPETIPDGIKGWSWGAFLLGPIWAVGNKTWIGLIAIVPYVGIIMSIILGIYGREWAWKNKKWDSVEHFNRVQKTWSKWGVGIILAVFFIGVVAAIAVPAYHDYQRKAQEARRAESERVTEEAEAEKARLRAQSQPVVEPKESSGIWSREFKDSTYNECASRALEKGNVKGVAFCACLTEKASVLLSEDEMLRLETDPVVNRALQGIAASCSQ